MENVVELCQYMQSKALDTYIALLDRRFYSYVTIQNEMIGVFNDIDKKYNLKGEMHNEHILDTIQEDCSFKQGQ